MNTCKLCGAEPSLPTHNVCEECAYELNKRLNDWIAAPSLALADSLAERNNDHGINRSHD